MDLDAPAAVANATPGAAVGGWVLESLLRRDAGGAAIWRVAGSGGARGLMRLTPPAGDDHGAAFAREAALLRELALPGTPELLDSGEAPEGLYEVTLAVDGSTLAELLAAGLPPMQVIRILGDAADTLDAVHRAGLGHGGVRPVNVLVEEGPVERALLVNFELGRPRERSRVSPEEAPYAAPETLTGEPATPSSDIYALACVLFEGFTGQPPFGREAQAALRGHLEGAPPRADGLAPALQEVLARGLARSPAERFPSAGALVEEAARALLRPAAEPAPAPAATADSTPAVAAEEAEPEPLAAIPAPSHEEPAPQAPSEGRGRRLLGRTLPLWAAIATIAVAGAAGLVVSWVLDDDGGGSSGADAGRALRSGRISLEAPAGWSARPAPQLGVGLERPAAAGPGPGAAAGMVAGLSTDERAALDPGRVARELDAGAPRPDLVRLGRLEALRWRRLRDGKAATGVTLFVAPTSAGAAVVACVGAGAAGERQAAACERSAAGLAVRGARTFSAAAATRWRAGLARQMSRLRARRRVRLVRLLRAPTRGAQARQAASLAAAHRSAARAVKRLATPPQAAEAGARVGAALAALDSAYRRLGRAARRNDHRGYARARGAIRRADGRLTRALRAV